MPVGQIRLGRQTEVVYETTAPFLWTAAADGDAVWLGSGNDGRVFRVDEDGTGAEVFNAGELNAHAVTPLGDGSAYVRHLPRRRTVSCGAGGASLEHDAL